jgi:DNA-binding IclR family transcriptional regulator
MQKTTVKVASYPISSVEKALGVLNMLADRKTLRVKEVSRELLIAPSTAHRLLAMFEQSGFLHQKGRNSFYTVGPALARVATVISDHLDIETAIRPQLLELVSEFNETALVCVLREDHAVFLDCVESSRGVRAVSQTGRVVPAHVVAGGKALLAELSPTDLVRVYPGEYLKRMTRKSLATRTALFDDLRRIRDRGFATNTEESEPRFAAYAAAVRDRVGHARAAIVLAGPASRFRRYEPGRIAAAVRAACAAAGAALE